MKAFQSLIQAGNWELQPPLVVKGVTIRGETVEPAPKTVERPLKMVMLADNSLIDCHAKVENGRTRVDMRPVCDALKAALPTGTALAALNPVVVPPGVTRVDLRPLAEGSGWELLTHKMADEGKIYLRKKA